MAKSMFSEFLKKEMIKKLEEIGRLLFKTPSSVKRLWQTEKQEKPGIISMEKMSKYYDGGVFFFSYISKLQRKYII